MIFCPSGHYMGYSTRNGKSAKMSKSFYREGDNCFEIGAIRGEDQYNATYKAKSTMNTDHEIIRELHKQGPHTSHRSLFICNPIDEAEYKTALEQATLSHDMSVRDITMRMMQEDTKSKDDFYHQCSLVQADKLFNIFRKHGEKSVESFSYREGMDYSHASLLQKLKE